MDNMTALVSAFARAYHYKNNHIHVFADPLAEKMLTDEEYAVISENMAQGVAYFAPNFQGSREDALRLIVDHQLAAAAGEQMKAQYSCDELEKLLSEAGFLEYEHLDAEEATEIFFQDYNRSNEEDCMRAPAGVGYCLAVKTATDHEGKEGFQDGI